MMIARLYTPKASNGIDVHIGGVLNWISYTVIVKKVCIWCSDLIWMNHNIRSKLKRIYEDYKRSFKYLKVFFNGFFECCRIRLCVLPILMIGGRALALSISTTSSKVFVVMAIMSREAWNVHLNKSSKCPLVRFSQEICTYL